MKRRWLVGLLGGLVLALVVGVVALLGSLKPERAAPELAQVQTPSVRLSEPDPGDLEEVQGQLRFPDGSPADDIEVRLWRAGQGRVASVRSDADGRYILLAQPGDNINLGPRSSDPSAHVVEAQAGPYDFITPERCPIQLRVEDPQGNPLSPGTVTARIQSEGFVQPSLERQIALEAEGWTPVETACGQGTLEIQVPGWSQARAAIDTLEETDKVVVIEQGVEVYGRVTSLAGDPITEGRVRVFRLGVHVDLAADGTYSLFLPASETHTLTAQASQPGFKEASHPVRFAPGQESLELDFVLEPFRLVEVKCLGFPEDSCVTVTPVFCTRPRLPLGGMCSGNPTSCQCPPGEVAVRAGGRSVLVGADEDIALLDFRDATGAVSGRVLRGSSPARCRWTVAKVPEFGELAADLSGGGVVARQGRCEKDGSFLAEGLEPGRYLVELTTGESRAPQPDVWVESGVVDLGDIDIGGGGVITGVVYSGLTGEPENNQPVLTTFAQRETVNPVGAGALSDQDGVFEITGLDDGEYAVFLAQRPLERVSVTVQDGVASQDVVLETGEAKLLEEQGFSVSTNASGELEVAAVESGSMAEAAGLQRGDVLLGVVVMGMDVLELAPHAAQQATAWALDNYSGPGMTLVVRRGGAEVEVALE